MDRFSRRNFSGRLERLLGQERVGAVARTNSCKILTLVRYQRAFVDFFEDQLVARRYDLQDLLDEYLLQGKEPLINGLISGRR